MLESIKAFFATKMAAPAETSAAAAADARHPEIQVAACALLLELAYADAEFTLPERRHLEAAIQRHFALPPETAKELIQLADEERQQAVDLFQFTSLIAREYSEAQKLVLLEAMWGLVFADGEVAKHETSLMRRLSKLLDVRPGFLAEARKSAERGR